MYSSYEQHSPVSSSLYDSAVTSLQQERVSEATRILEQLVSNDPYFDAESHRVDRLTSSTLLRKANRLLESAREKHLGAQFQHSAFS